TRAPRCVGGYSRRARRPPRASPGAGRFPLAVSRRGRFVTAAYRPLAPAAGCVLSCGAGLGSSRGGSPLTRLGCCRTLRRPLPLRGEVGVVASPGTLTGRASRAPLSPPGRGRDTASCGGRGEG